MLIVCSGLVSGYVVVVVVEEVRVACSVVDEDVVEVVGCEAMNDDSVLGGRMI
jgi:formylmethanofuran dehydrogenase subunit E-like metal-binding protein